jgi:hypothetical protein
MKLWMKYLLALYVVTGIRLCVLGDWLGGLALLSLTLFVILDFSNSRFIWKQRVKVSGAAGQFGDAQYGIKTDDACACEKCHDSWGRRV